MKTWDNHIYITAVNKALFSSACTILCIIIFKIIPYYTIGDSDYNIIQFNVWSTLANATDGDYGLEKFIFPWGEIMAQANSQWLVSLHYAFHAIRKCMWSYNYYNEIAEHMLIKEVESWQLDNAVS